MKTKKDIEIELVNLQHELEELIEDETHGWANHDPEKEILQAKIDLLKWVLNYRL